MKVLSAELSISYALNVVFLELFDVETDSIIFHFPQLGITQFSRLILCSCFKNCLWTQKTVEEEEGAEYQSGLDSHDILLLICLTYLPTWSDRNGLKVDIEGFVKVVLVEGRRRRRRRRSSSRSFLKFSKGTFFHSIPSYPDEGRFLPFPQSEIRASWKQLMVHV